MEVIDNKSDRELLESLIAEIAKSTGELRCARGDIEKAQSRIKFCLMVAHKLIERKED
jgi:hypothetical protein